MPDGPPASGPRQSISLLVIGSEMASFTIVGLLLDSALGTLPGLTIGLTLLGLVVAFYHVRVLAKAMAAKSSRPTEPRQRSAP